MAVPVLPPLLFFQVSLRALPSHCFHWQETFEHLPFVWKTWYSNGKVHSGMFSEKVNTFLAFTEFTKISVPLILFKTISARLFPRRQQCPRWRIQGMNLYHSKLSVTLQLFYSLRHWYQTLQHNCGTQGEHDLGFGRRYLRFTTASTIPRAFQFNDAGKHLNPKPQIKWYDSIRFDRSVFLGKKKWPSICQMKSTESTLLHCRFLPNQLPNTWEVAVLIDFPLLSHHLALRLTGWEASCCRNRDRSH